MVPACASTLMVLSTCSAVTPLEASSRVTSAAVLGAPPEDFSTLSTSFCVFTRASDRDAIQAYPAYPVEQRDHLAAVVSSVYGSSFTRPAGGSHGTSIRSHKLPRAQRHG